MAVQRELLGQPITFFLKRDTRSAPLVMDMPRSSMVVDVALRVGMGLHLAQAEVNGLPVPLDNEAKVPNVAPLLSAMDASVRPNWVGCANLRETRTKICQNFQTHDREVCKERGWRLVWRLIKANHPLLEQATEKKLPPELRLDHQVQERTPFALLAEAYRNVSLSSDPAGDAVGIICKALGLPKAVSVGFDTNSILDVSLSKGGGLDVLTSARWVKRGKEGIAEYPQTHNHFSGESQLEVWRLCPNCMPLPGNPNLVAVESNVPASDNYTSVVEVHQGGCTFLHDNDVIVEEGQDIEMLTMYEP